jgi:putative transposase
MAAIRERDPAIPIVVPCEALGVSRASLYRGQPAGPKQGPRRQRRSPRKLSPDERTRLLDTLHAEEFPDERTRLLDTLHAEEFADQPPAEVYATLLERGDYVGSIRTMYRVLAEEGELRERRNQRQPHVHAKPSLTARAPNEVWTWDITKLATERK